ncbi:hypothetical protein [Serratia rubidaea]|uniref:Uncharacterized protein n=1 Tax=Serratia rubidaea TaxID=61652 RepID=A0A3S4WXU5_SERRU|nr:hypothetical protein [Serratia rubidaea]MBH1932161.1 hypothetical protein [Serratia rubidaea]MDC6117950.1 hypothetical protein [Serratia rubidaea]VEI66892.1 Uncharacterised protein [Serratia rubidaea]
MNFIDDSVINEWLCNNNAVISDSLSVFLFDKLSSLPWVAGHVDYSKLKHRFGNIQDMLSCDGEIEYFKVKDWLKGSKFEYGSHILFWYGKDNPCVVCQAKFGLSNIDSAYWGVPGWNYIFSCNFENGEVKVDCDNVLSFDGMSELVLLIN